MRLTDRIALVTGASRGIGRAVALALAAEGAHVIATARTRGALEELDDEIQENGGKATLLPMGLTKGDKVDGLGPTIYERWGRLDIFVGAAGILGPLSPVSHLQEKDWRDVLETNLTANWKLIRTLDPVLRRSDAARAIFVTSSAARKNKAFWGAYSVSKAALESLVKTYADEIEKTNIKVNLINPGPVATDMRAKAYPGEDPKTITQPQEVAELFIDMASPGYLENGQVVDFERSE